MNTTNLLQTIKYARLAHKDQKRKNSAKDDYIVHAIDMADFIQDVALDLDIWERHIPTIQATFLHDTVEDTTVTIQDIARNFGNEVAGIVSQVSDNKSLSKMERKMLQLKHANTMSREAAIVKLADKWHNCRDLADDPPKGWTETQIMHYVYWSYKICKVIVEDWKSCDLIQIMWSRKVRPLFEEVHKVDDKLVDQIVAEYFEALKDE